MNESKDILLETIEKLVNKVDSMQSQYFALQKSKLELENSSNKIEVNLANDLEDANDEYDKLTKEYRLLLGTTKDKVIELKESKELVNEIELTVNEYNHQLESTKKALKTATDNYNHEHSKVEVLERQLKNFKRKK